MENKETISKEFLAKARGFLRITEDDDVINAEIETHIKACRMDLIRNGITSKKANSMEDSLIESAIFLYLKAEFGLDNKNYDRFRNSYETLRTELALTDEYISEVLEDVE